MQKLVQDVRFAVRQMARTPGFSLTAILSLALGIGATVSVFSVIYSAVLNAWPYAGFDRVCQINTIDKSGHEGGPGFTGPQVRRLRQVSAVEDVIAMNRWDLVITGTMFRKTCTRFTLPGMHSNISGCRRFSAAFSCPRTHLTRKILNRWQS